MMSLELSASQRCSGAAALALAALAVVVPAALATSLL